MSSQAMTALQSQKMEARTVVICGGSTGIGAGVARLYAKLGAPRIIVTGRDEAKGNALIDVMRSLAPASSAMDVSFVKTDLIDIKGMQLSVEAIRSALGGAKIDHLIMTQNGMVTGTLIENGDGDERGYAVQTLSRFVVPYELLKTGSLAEGGVILSACNPGQSLDSLDVDDLSLKAIKNTGRYTLPFLFDQSKRDSTVIDAVNLELSARYPHQRFVHVAPGLVKTENFGLGSFPFPFNFVAMLGVYAMRQTPDTFASVPIYLAVAADAKPGVYTCFGHDLKPMQPGAWAQKEENRRRLFEALVKRVEG